MHWLICKEGTEIILFFISVEKTPTSSGGE